MVHENLNYINCSVYSPNTADDIAKWQQQLKCLDYYPYYSCSRPLAFRNSVDQNDHSDNADNDEENLHG